MMKITVAGTGYVGLSMAVLLAQHNDVTAVDIIPEKVELLNSRKSPIADEYIEKYLAEKPLSLTATTDWRPAYTSAELVAAPVPPVVWACLSGGWEPWRWGRSWAPPSSPARS